jgi:dephospho-CoA kinase
MKVVGLTGGIASGKSIVSGMMADFGAKIIDLDQIAREVVEPNKPAWQEIIEYFGEKILLSDRTIDRKKLGEMIFANSEAREKLNEITHSRIVRELFKLIERYRREKQVLVVVDAALLFETKMDGWLKPVIVVSANEEKQIKRLQDRDGYRREQALKRIQAQMPLKEKVRHADYVINNSGSWEDTRKQVETVWKKIMET